MFLIKQEYNEEIYSIGYVNHYKKNFIYLILRLG